MAATPYDEVPYLSYAIRQTHVSNLYLIGRLFGMHPPPAAGCKVLEIGGASGGNLIPMAAALPQSEFLCVDPARRQIEQGRRHAEELGLTNLRFEAGGVEDLGGKARFDYVICHGVFSWVPQPVQEAILRVLQTCLTPDGIAFVSYNALPGRHAYNALREVLLRHCGQERSPEGKARLAREMLGLVEKGAADPRSLWGPLLVAEMQRLRAVSDEFLLHEYLDEYSEAFYFSAFMAKARRYGLQYLGECDVHTMYVANPVECMPAAVVQSGDIEAMEQYIDFGLNRAFRQTLLCRDSVALERGLALDAVDGYYVQSSLLPESPGLFRAPSGAGMSSSDPLVTEILATLARDAGLPVSAESAMAEVRSRLPGREPEAVRTAFRRTVLQAFLAGGMQLSSLPPAHVASVSTRPRASSVARHEAKYGSVVTNGRHEAVVLSELERRLVQVLDGENSQVELARHVGADLAICSKTLERFAATALLYG
jgi:2-polyprenyl-3-methyl-5-hydroxy-6-metoxy-1,4-benzoquinol methylase/methyltransferase-like protein